MRVQNDHLLREGGRFIFGARVCVCEKGRKRALARKEARCERLFRRLNLKKCGRARLAGVLYFSHMFEEPGASPWEHTFIAASPPSQPTYEAPIRPPVPVTEGGGDWAQSFGAREEARDMSPDEVYEQLQRALENAQAKKVAAQEQALQVRQQIAQRQAQLAQLHGQPVSLEVVRDILKRMEQEMLAIEREVNEAAQKLRPFELVAETSEMSSHAREEFEQVSRDMEAVHREKEGARSAWAEATRQREDAQARMFEWQNALLRDEGQYGQELEGLRKGVAIARDALEEVRDKAEDPNEKDKIKPGDTRTYAEFFQDMQDYLEAYEPRLVSLENHFNMLEEGLAQAASWAQEKARAEQDARATFEAQSEALSELAQRREAAYTSFQTAEGARAQQSAEVLFRTQQENARRRSARISSAYH